MKKLIAVVALAMMALLAFPLIAGAGSVDLQGRGVLEARGSGKATIEGKLNFFGQGGAGVLVVEDKAGDAKIDVKGYGKRIDEGNGKVRFVGFNGRAHIVGSRVAITIEGKDIRFVVKGVGKATLRGKGVYRTNHGQFAPWSESGVTVQFTEASTAAAT